METMSGVTGFKHAASTKFNNKSIYIFISKNTIQTPFDPQIPNASQGRPNELNTHVHYYLNTFLVTAVMLSNKGNIIASNNSYFQ